MHGYIDHHEDPTRFSSASSQREQRKALRSRSWRATSAPGFPDPGIGGFMGGPTRDEIFIARPQCLTYGCSGTPGGGPLNLGVRQRKVIRLHEHRERLLVALRSLLGVPCGLIRWRRTRSSCGFEPSLIREAERYLDRSALRSHVLGHPRHREWGLAGVGRRRGSGGNRPLWEAWCATSIR